MLFFLVCSPLAASAQSTPLDVYVSIAPQRFIVDRIGGSRIRSHLLVERGQDPHTFEPTPRRLLELAAAKLYFTVGLPFEHTLTTRLGGSFTGLRFAAMDRGIDKLPMMEGHGEEHNHRGEADPHIWLAPQMVMKMAQNTFDALVALDPAHAEEYRGRLQDLKEQLTEVDQRLSRELQPYKGRAFYVFHPAFGYFAAAYGLQQLAVETGGHSPGPRQLAALISRARDEKVRMIFVQPQFDTKGAESVARAIDGVVIPLDSLAYDLLGNFVSIADKVNRSFR